MSTYVPKYWGIGNFPKYVMNTGQIITLKKTSTYYQILSDTNVPRYHFDNCQDNLTVASDVVVGIKTIQNVIV